MCFFPSHCSPLRPACDQTRLRTFWLPGKAPPVGESCHRMSTVVRANYATKQADVTDLEELEGLLSPFQVEKLTYFFNQFFDFNEDGKIDVSRTIMEKNLVVCLYLPGVRLCRPERTFEEGGELEHRGYRVHQHGRQQQGLLRVLARAGAGTRLQPLHLTSSPHRCWLRGTRRVWKREVGPRLLLPG